MSDWIRNYLIKEGIQMDKHSLQRIPTSRGIMTKHDPCEYCGCEDFIILMAEALGTLLECANVKCGKLKEIPKTCKVVIEKKEEPVNGGCK